MKIIFMGTPEFSVPTLKALINSEHEVVACYTQPDRPKGRGKKVIMTPVKEVCLEANIPVYQPKRIRNEADVNDFKEIEADVAVVIAYGQILPKSILEYPKYGCINIHASLLPKLRGAAPYQWAVINGDSVTGITTMQMDSGIDTGDMLMKMVINIEPDETAGSLHDKLMVSGGELLLQTLEGIESCSIEPIQQNNEDASKAPMLDKNFGKIDWTKSAEEIERLIRGLNPWPSAFTFMNGSLIKIWKADVRASENSDYTPGTICEIIPKEGFLIRCGEGSLLIKEVQLQGKKRMDTASLMNGYEIAVGSILE